MEACFDPLVINYFEPFFPRRNTCRKSFCTVPVACKRVLPACHVHQLLAPKTHRRCLSTAEWIHEKNACTTHEPPAERRRSSPISCHAQWAMGRQQQQQQQQVGSLNRSIHGKCKMNQSKRTDKRQKERDYGRTRRGSLRERWNQERLISNLRLIGHLFTKTSPRACERTTTRILKKVQY